MANELFMKIAHKHLEQKTLSKNSNGKCVFRRYSKLTNEHPDIVMMTRKEEEGLKELSESELKTLAHILAENIQETQLHVLYEQILAQFRDIRARINDPESKTD